MPRNKKIPPKTPYPTFKILILKYQMAASIRNEKKDAVEIKNNILK
jgi:hypothetical protein